MKPKMPKLIKFQNKFQNIEIEEEEDGLSIWIGHEDYVKEITLIDKKGNEHKLPIRGLNDEFPFWEIGRDGSPDGAVQVIYGDGKGNKRCNMVCPNREGELKHSNITVMLKNLPYKIQEIRIR